MKRILSFLMLGAIVAFTSCQKEAYDPVGNGSEISVTVNAKTGTMQTRAAAPSGIDNYVLAVYYQGQLYGEQQTSTNGTFNVKLVSGKPFTIICWADQGENFYTTTDLTAIKLTETDQYAGNDARRDAFVGKTDITLTANSSINIVMKRPFGQVNIKTNDFSDVKDPLIPTHISIAYASIPTQFNALTGDLSNSKQMTFTTSALGKASDNQKTGEKWLSFDYIFASETEKDLIDFSATFSNAGDNNIVVNEDFKSVPVQRNFRTFVSGNLLTKTGGITFDFQAWDTPDYAKEIVEVSKPSEITSNNISSTQNAFVVTDQVASSDATVTIPEAVTATTTTSLSFSFPQGVAADATLEIKDENASSQPYDGDVYINVASGTSVTVNLPSATVYLNGTKVTNIGTLTAANTFVVAKDSEITGTLTVNGGNVYVYGKVGTIVRGNDNQDAITTIYVFPGATVTTLTETASLKRVDVTGGIITNVTKGKKYPTVKTAVADADANDVIELTEGDYPLTADVAKITSNQDRFLYIDKNLTIKGVGNVGVYGETVIPSPGGGVGHAQSTIFIGNNANAKFENITFMPHINEAYTASGYANKTVEILAGAVVNAVNCKFVPNTKVSGYTNTSGGSLYFAQSTFSAVGCTFEKASFTVDGLMSGNLLTKDCTFDAGFISTVNWTSNDVSKSTMVINVENCKFLNTANSPVAEERIIQAKFGTINLKNCQFPTNVTYWKAIESGFIIVNGKAEFTQGQFDAFSKSENRFKPANVEFLEVYEGVNNIVKYTVNANSNPENRGDSYKGSFYNTQGCNWNLFTNNNTKWEATCKVYVTSEMLTNTKPFRAEVWTSTTPTSYPLFGVANVDADNVLTGNGAKWRIWSVDGEGGWTDTDAEVTSGWHTLTIICNGSSVNYILDGMKIGTASSANITVACTAIFPMVYNFNKYDGTSYSDYAFDTYFGEMTYTVK